MRHSNLKATPPASTSPTSPEPTQTGGELRQAWVAAGSDEKSWILRLEDGRMCGAKRAAACLLQPEQGDNVLAYAPASGPAFILSVLEKAGSRSRLALDGDVELSVSQGQLSLKAEKVALDAAKQLDLRGEDVNVSGARGALDFLDTSLRTLRLDVRARHALAMCDSVRSVARDLVQHLHNSLRRVKNTETLEAGRLRERIAHSRQTLAQDVKVKARRRMKLDGERIDLG